MTNNYKYVIIGGGMAAAAAVEGIRQVDAVGSIGLISAEHDAPYNRPPLSKALWKGKSVDTIWRKMDNNGIQVYLGRIIKKIVPQDKQIVDDKGAIITYEKLLLATGGTPRRLPFGDDQIIYYRTLADYRRLRALTEKGQRFAVIGGGFIGSEIAAALALNGKEVVMIFPGQGIGDRIFPREISEFVSRYYQQKGVELLARERIISCEMHGAQHILKTATNRAIEVDGVIAGIGIEPNLELAESAGLKTEDGIVVDEFLRTRQSDIYAAGDVADFYNPSLGKRLRVEHEDNANTMGQRVGRNMAGASERYDYLPSFYSDMFDLGFEAVGDVDSRLETLIDWKRPHEEGVIYYLRAGRVRGVLLWNVWDQLEAARRLISEPGPFTVEELKGRLPVKIPVESNVS